MAGLSQSDWIRVLWEFGPCAFFVFMVFIGLRMARHNQGLNPAQQKVQNVAFSVVWLSIFVLAALSILVYWKINFPTEEPEIRGFIRNLEDPEIIDTSDNIFLKKHRGTYSDYDVEFRITDPKPNEGYVTFVLARSINDIKAPRYRIPVKEEFFHGILNITYDRVSGNMTLAHEGEHRKLEKFVDAAEGPTQPIDKDRLIRALGASDPIIRDNARKLLISIGPRVADDLVSSFALSNSANGDYPTRPTFLFEILRTLNAMEGLDQHSLSRASTCYLIRAANNSLADVAEQARIFLGRHVLEESSCHIEKTWQELQLRSVQVSKLGYAGSMYWRFEVFLNEKMVASTPEYDFSAALTTGKYPIPTNGAIFTVNSPGAIAFPPVKLADSSPSVQIKVLAYRRGETKPLAWKSEIVKQPAILRCVTYPLRAWLHTNNNKFDKPNKKYDKPEAQLDVTEIYLSFLLQ